MSKTYNVGDIVKLKSGGPEMTIDGLRSNLNGGGYKCQWFAGKKLSWGSFPYESLTVVKEETS